MDEYDIYKYSHTDSILDRLGQRRAQAERVVYTQTLTSHIVYDDDRVHTVGPKVDRVVEDALARCELIDHEIDRWQTRQRLFNEWLDTLDENQRYMVTTHPDYAPQSLQQEAQSEIREIETFIAYHEGIEPPEEEIEVPDDPVAGVGAMADFLEAN